jgi:hypothetical protein
MSAEPEARGHKMTRIAAWAWFAIIQLSALLVTILGWVLLIPFAALRLWTVQDSPYFPGRKVEVWRGGLLMFPWGNLEDGVIGAEFYRARYKDDRLCAYLWSAWRNSANNLRFLFRWLGGPFWRWENSKHTFYIQIGWNTSGFPVLSAGSM